MATPLRGRETPRLSGSSRGEGPGYDGASLAGLYEMPRRLAPDKLALEVGQRIRDIRIAAGLTIEQLAETSKLGSKGHLSNMERGLVRPNIQTLKLIANGLGVLPLDLMTFPKKDVRQKLVEMTRKLSTKQLDETVRWLVRKNLAAPAR